MSDYSISIVPRLSKFPNREIKSNELVNWLISKDIIKPTLTNCLLGIDEKGFAVSQGAVNITIHPEYLPFGLRANGLEIVAKRTIFTTFQNGIDSLICPRCNQDIADEDWNFFNEWASGDSNNLNCPKCKIGTEIHDFRFDPVWGFSDFGFIFWNWPQFTDRFIGEFQQKLGYEIDVVHAHI